MVEVLTNITALLTALFALFQFFKSRREKMRMVRENFNAVIAALSANVEVERLAGAILLRRFFDRKTEVGVAGTPYWKEAVNVTAAILRGRETGHFQKLLADGLAFAPSLERADLQRTNLQAAYLGWRDAPKANTRIRPLLFWRDAAKGDAKVRTLLTGADFFRADLSDASLKGANAQGAAFYQARLQGTVFTEANLEGANFFQADLKGARFEKARLRGAKFGGAVNLPPRLVNHLDPDGVYYGPEEFEPPARAATTRPVEVFISKPACLSQQQREQVAAIVSRVESEGIRVQQFDPPYPPSGALIEVERRMTGCAGVIVFGFCQLHVRDGSWRHGTHQQADVKDADFPTSWNHIETGMAVVLGLPLLVVAEGDVRGGVFDMTSAERHLHRLKLRDDLDARTQQDTFSSWCADVRERGLTNDWERRKRPETIEH